MYTIFSKLQAIFDRPSIEELAAYQHKMPQSIAVDIQYDQETGFYTARITKLGKEKISDLLITESRTEKDLVKMVNDLILTYLDFPERIKYNMPPLLPVDIDFADTRSKNTNLVFAK